MKTKVIIKKLIKETAGGSHGWYESNVGVIRKPLGVIYENEKEICKSTETSILKNKPNKTMNIEKIGKEMIKWGIIFIIIAILIKLIF